MFIYGHRGVFAKKYKEIRESIKRMVVESLFDPVALRLYFTGRKKSLREIFQLGETKIKVDLFHIINY